MIPPHLQFAFTLDVTHAVHWPVYWCPPTVVVSLRTVSLCPADPSLPSKPVLPLQNGMRLESYVVSGFQIDFYDLVLLSFTDHMFLSFVPWLEAHFCLTLSVTPFSGYISLFIHSSTRVSRLPPSSGRYE